MQLIILLISKMNIDDDVDFEPVQQYRSSSVTIPSSPFALGIISFYDYSSWFHVYNSQVPLQRDGNQEIEQQLELVEQRNNEMRIVEVNIILWQYCIV